MWQFVVESENVVEGCVPGRRVTLDLAGAPLRADAMTQAPASTVLASFLDRQPSLGRLTWPVIEEVLATGGVDVAALRWRHPVGGI
jgi:hypothetical protein